MGTVLIRNAYLLTGDDFEGSNTPGWVFISGERIMSLGYGQPPVALNRAADSLIDGRGMVLTRGLVNAHTHLSQTFMKGLADELGLFEALKRVIWPLQSAMTPRDVKLASLLGLIENLRGGVTCVVEHAKTTSATHLVDAVAEAALEVGMRMRLVRAWADSGEGGEDLEAIHRSATHLYERWHSGPSGLVSVGLGPLAPWRCSDEGMRRLASLAREWGVPTHMHVAETYQEVRELQCRTGLRPVQWLSSMGVLGEDVQLVHCVWLSDADLDLIAEHGGVVVHCPVSNMQIAAGVAPIHKMLERGIPVMFGTDGAATNTSQNLLETLKYAVILANACSNNPTRITARKAVGMITDSSHAFNQSVGGITVGAEADLALFEVSSLGLGRVGDPACALVHAGARAHTVIVRGQILLEAGRVVALDEAALLEECRSAADNLLRRTGFDSPQGIYHMGGDVARTRTEYAGVKASGF